MATPVNDAYAGPAGADIYAGMFAPASDPRSSLLDAIAAAPANSWVKANTNTYQSAWIPSDYRPLYQGAPASPSKIILAWSGIGWDNQRSRLILFGGGHANTDDSSVYAWDAATRQWGNAFYPADFITTNPPRNADSYAGSPISAHTYANQGYLPSIDRFVTFGGGAQPGGGPWAFYDTTTGALQRYVGGYTLDMAQAGQGKVAGVAGSNPKRGTSAGVSLPGANAWAVRDWALDHAQANGLVPHMVDHINGFIDIVQENGHDVIYMQAGAAGQTQFGLYRIEIVDADYHNDIITIVGNWYTGRGRCPSGCVDTARRIAIYPGYATLPLCGYDLTTPGATNYNFTVPTAGIAGNAVVQLDISPNLNSGDGVSFLYDATRNRSVAYTWAGEVIDIRAPASGPITAGWAANLLADATQAVRPPLASELGVNGVTSINGKWKYAHSLDAYLLLTHNLNGDIWLFKPDNWIDPRS